MLDYSNLVPDLNLCRHIPRGLFEKSLFVWEDRRGRIMDAPFNRVPVVRRRRLEEDVDGADGVCPAPTRNEMFWSLQQSKVAIREVSCRFLRDGQKVVTWKYDTDKVVGLEISLVDNKVENAMLRIWMSLLDRLDS